MLKPTRYVLAPLHKEPTAVEFKYRGLEKRVKIGYKCNPKRPIPSPHYFDPRMYKVESGKVILVVAGKGMGKTNLMRNIIQAYYRTTTNPIIVFQEKAGDLNFNRYPTLRQCMRLGIEYIRLAPPTGKSSVQRYLVPLRDRLKREEVRYKIPLCEIDYSSLEKYVSKRIGSTWAGMILERVWQNPKNIQNIDMLRRAVECELIKFEDDKLYDQMVLFLERFFQILEMDQLLEVHKAVNAEVIFDDQMINIVDLSDLSDIEQKQFVVAQTLKMVERLYKRRECFIGITETHTYAPEAGSNPAKDAIVRLVTVLARSYGWIVFLETQSPDALERIVLENADEIYILGYIQKSKLSKLIKCSSVCFEGFVDKYYKVVEDIPKGRGIWGSVVNPTKPYLVQILRSPVG